VLKRVIGGAVVVLLLAAAAYAAFFIAPTDSRQGLIYRIIFLHVPCAETGLVSFFVCFVANIAYVLKRSPKWDWLGVSAAEVGLVFTSACLVTGPIWAKPVWGIWWTWDARLTSTAVLWLLYVAYLMLRTLIDEPDRRALLSALFGIFAFIDVPLVFGSIRWWRTQHPQPVIMGGPGSGLDPLMYKVLFFCWVPMLALMVLLMQSRYRLEAMRDDFELIRRESEAA
jgi:heme exporter protein C